MALILLFLPQPLLLVCDAEAIWDTPHQMLLSCLKHTVQATGCDRECPEGAEMMRLRIVPRIKWKI